MQSHSKAKPTAVSSHLQNASCGSKCEILFSHTSLSFLVSVFLQKSYTDMLTCNMKNAHMFGCVSIISIEM